MGFNGRQNGYKYDQLARASINVNAPVAKVWDALTNPEKIKQYMFGTTVVSDWKQGSSIVWKGEWKGKAYEDKGVILRLEPNHTIQYSHYSPLSGQPDVPQNYHTVSIDLTGQGQQTHISLTQDNNASEKERQESAKNWEMMLKGLKQAVE